MEGSAGRRDRDGPWRPQPGAWSMAQLPPRCEHEAGRQGAEFLPRKLASGMVLGTFTLGTQELPLRQELELDVCMQRPLLRGQLGT